MDKIDLKKGLGYLYGPKNTDWQSVEVPPMNFLMIDGAGDPNTVSEYKEAVEALYSVSYAIKFTSKRELGRDYAVMPLEGLWEWEGLRDKSKFKWTMMIMQPEWITGEMVETAIRATEVKKRPPALSKMRFENYAEGNALQLLHVGSYDDEAPKLAYLHETYIPEHGLKETWRHHEIYLSDPRKTEASKLKTIVRQPVEIRNAAA